MEDESSTDSTAPLDREITINQLVAWNIARYRRAANLTQQELGERLGWTNTAVSDAERSWQGKRTREFDAHTLVHLSLALGVPVIGLLLPPDDDEAPCSFRGPAGQRHDMGDLMALAVMPDSDEDDQPMGAYRDRLRAAATRYLDPEWADELAGWLREAESDDLLADRAARLRAHQAELRQAAEDIGDLASAIEKRRGQP